MLSSIFTNMGRGIPEIQSSEPGKSRDLDLRFPHRKESGNPGSLFEGENFYFG